MLFENNDRIVFAGDSVTDMGSVNPVGEGLFDNLGHGYVRMFENFLTACYPQMNIRIPNSGISGNTSRDLLMRYERDVIALKPDWVSILIGINDVWRQFDTPAMKDMQVMPDEYYKNLEPEKIIAMVAYQFSLEKLQLMQRNDTTPYTEKVKELTELLEDYFKKE